MNTTLALWMKIALTAVVISALLFSVGYALLGNESDKYISDIQTKETSVFK